MSEATSEHTPVWTEHRVKLRPVARVGLRRAALPAIEEAKRVAGDFVLLKIGPFRVYLVSDPDAIEEVLVRKHRNFIRGEPEWSYLRKGLGNGLVTSDGEFHQRQRRLVQPAFGPRQMAGYANTVLEVTERFHKRWHEGAGQTRDVADDMMRLTMLVIAKLLFGIDLEEEAERVGLAVTDLNEASTTFDASLGGYLGFIPTRASRRVRRAVRYLDGLIERILAERRRDEAEHDDILAMLLASGMNDRALRDEVVTLFGAGHETTANMLAWTWYALAQNPDAEVQMHDELDRVLGGRAPTIEDLPQLAYTERVMRESMRLYPPVWVNGRGPETPDTIAGRPVPAGAVVGTVPYLVQRDPRWFPDPLRFDPDRFAPEAVRDRHRFAYFPFGGGTRRCIGQTFAEMEGMLVLGALAQHFTPRLHEGQTAELEPMVSLRPKGGLPMRVLPRA